MNKKRPINLDLTTMKFPPMAIVSILHRISGIVLFLFLPFILYMVYQSLPSEQAFLETKAMLLNPIYKFMLWAFSTALIYHVIAGLRHMIMDIGYGEHLNAGRRSAVIVIALAVILAILVGIWIW